MRPFEASEEGSARRGFDATLCGENSRLPLALSSWSLADFFERPERASAKRQSGRLLPPSARVQAEGSEAGKFAAAHSS